jgi:peptide/nickel transport system substrate-binding protein
MKKFCLAKVIGISLAMFLLLSVSPVFASSSLVIALDAPPRTMNPHGSDADSNLSIMANFFDGLLQLSNGEFKPALALRYEHPDLNTWIFYLRKGVKFHNGNSFTAGDVKFSFERLSDPEVSEFINTGKTLESIKVIDDYTIEFKTFKPIPWFANNLHQIFIMDKESCETRDNGAIGTMPIGTGAYKLKEWVRGSYLKLEANADYWEGEPAIKNIELRPITESSTRFAALVSGHADMVSGVPVELYEKILKNPKLTTINRPARRAVFLALGNKVGSPTADIRVRKAMYMAINENEIIEKIMRGHAAPAAQIIDPPTIGYNSDIKRLAYDPAKSKALLKEAGYENGFEITLAGPNDRYVQDEKIAEAVVKYLAKVGIKAKLDIKPKSIFFPEVSKGVHDFYLIGWFDGAFDMARTYFKLIHTDGAWNGTRFTDGDIDKALEATADIVNPDDRRKAIERLNKMAMDQKIAWIPLHYQQDIYAIQKGKNINFIPRADRWIIAKEISFK